MHNRLKLSVSKERFFNNPNENWVGCKLHYKLNGPKNLIEDIQHFIDTHKHENIKLEDDVVAYANLDPQDDFDITIGKKIAMVKAESMAYNWIWGLIDRYLDYIDSNTALLDDFCSKAGEVKSHNLFYLNKF